MRLRDIVLRDAAGATVAVAPKAEVGLSGTSLLTASPRAESFRLVDANMTIRIDPDGQVNVLVGGEQPFVTIAPVREAQAAPPNATVAAPAPACIGSAAAQQAPQQKTGPIFSLQALTERSVASNVARAAGLGRSTRQART